MKLESNGSVGKSASGSDNKRVTTTSADGAVQWLTTTAVQG